MVSLGIIIFYTQGGELLNEKFKTKKLTYEISDTIHDIDHGIHPYATIQDKSLRC